MALTAVVVFRGTSHLTLRFHWRARHWLTSELLLCHHRCDKAVAAPAQRLYDPLSAAIVTHCFANRHDAVVECRIANKLIRPYMLEQFLLGHDAVAMQNQKGKRIEDACLEL
jgi:hypothetical protein